MNLATVIVLLVVLLLVVAAVKAIRGGKGRCSCGDTSKKKSCNGCSHCNSDCPFR